MADFARGRVIAMRKAGTGKRLHVGSWHLSNRHAVGVAGFATVGTNLHVRQGARVREGLDVWKTNKCRAIHIDTMADIAARADTVMVEQ